jgi:hypothetical protein
MRPRPQACPAALAFIASSPYDIRPLLVAMHYRDDGTHTPRVLAHAHAYLVGSCARRQLMFRDDLMRAATAHGLLRLCRPVVAQSVGSRAKQYRIRAGNFCLLSDASRNLFRPRLTEGAGAFLNVAADSADPSPAGTLLSPWADGTWWSRVEAGRRNRVKLLELEVGSWIRPRRTINLARYPATTEMASEFRFGGVTRRQSRLTDAPRPGKRAAIFCPIPVRESRRSARLNCSIFHTNPSRPIGLRGRSLCAHGNVEASRCTSAPRDPESRSRGVRA